MNREIHPLSINGTRASFKINFKDLSALLPINISKADQICPDRPDCHQNSSSAHGFINTMVAKARSPTCARNKQHSLSVNH